MNGDSGADRVLAECDRTPSGEPAGSGDRLRVSLRSYHGRTFVDLRVFWHDEHGELRPGKGTSVRRHELRQVIEALEAAEVELGEAPGIGGASFTGRDERRQPGQPRGTTSPRPQQRSFGDDFEPDGERPRY